MKPHDRFQAHYDLPEITKEGQRKITKAKVVVVGCGGLGNFCAFSLAGLGIGNLTLVDDDVIELENLQRQLLFSEADIGKPKCKVIKTRLLQHNSALNINAISKRVGSDNVNTIIKDSTIVIDCTDNFASRLIIDQYCHSNNIPLVFGGVKGFEGQVSVFNYNSGKSLSQTFKDKQDIFQSENCKDSGVLAPVVAIIGNLQVLEVVKIILELPHILQGKMMFFNSLKNQFREFNLK